jgi:hypothetical protein
MVHLADSVVPPIGDEDISGSIHRDAVGIVQGRGGGLSTVAAVTAAPVSGHRADHSAQTVHFADPVVPLIGDEQVAADIEC